MPELTPNLGLKKPLGNETVSRAAYNENLDIMDAAAVKKGDGIAELTGGTLDERPDPGVAGRYYFAQDKGEIWFDTGEEWVLAAASNAVLDAHLSEIATQESLGHVKVDGETITVSSYGIISAQTQIVDTVTSDKWKWGMEDGIVFLEKVVV